jgi:hypothetical protein
MNRWILHRVEKRVSAPASDQVMLDGIAGSSSARGDLDFAVDPGQVILHRIWTDDELFGDLSIGQSLRNATQHLDLTGGETIGRTG